MTFMAHPGLTVCDLKLMGGKIQHGRHSGGTVQLTNLYANSLDVCSLNEETEKSYCDF